MSDHYREPYCYSEVMAYTALAYSYWLVFTTLMDAYVMPTNDTDYGCHLKSHRTYSTNSVSRHIMPLVINSLGGSHIHTCTQTFAGRSDSKKPGARWPVASARLV